jgi:hypothetical protein
VVLTTILSALGTGIILAALQDLFHTLFHPAAHGAISDWIARITWKFFRYGIRRSITFAGPVAFATTVFYWTISLIVGFALIYIRHLPKAFTFAPGLEAEKYHSFWGALSVSLGGLITLSTGTYPKDLSLQLLMGFESILGFALLTASVSWILSIYPVLEHRRSMAQEGSLLYLSEIKWNRRLDEASDSELLQFFLLLISQLTTSRNELTQFPITYYFYEHYEETALARVLPYLADVASRNLSRSGASGLAASNLLGVIDDYLKCICAVFLGTQFQSREHALTAYANDHMREMIRSPRFLPKAA